MLIFTFVLPTAANDTNVRCGESIKQMKKSFAHSNWHRLNDFVSAFFYGCFSFSRWSNLWQHSNFFPDCSKLNWTMNYSSHHRKWYVIDDLLKIMSYVIIWLFKRKTIMKSLFNPLLQHTLGFKIHKIQKCVLKPRDFYKEASIFNIR